MVMVIVIVMVIFNDLNFMAKVSSDLRIDIKWYGYDYGYRLCLWL